MRTLTKQAIFNKVAQHLLIQARQSTNENGYCVYRGPNGLRCAAGALIPNRCYRNEFDDTDTDSSIGRWLAKLGPVALFGAELEPGAESLIARLQAIHDDADVSRWPEALRDEAAYRSLSPAVVDEFPDFTPKGE